AAEDYRFKDNTNGMGIDSLIASLDKPGIMTSSGQPKYIYFPANRSAKELQAMIKLVGANVSNETVELIGGKDKFEVDEDLNCIFFNTALYSRQNIEDMLKLYDVSHPEVRVSCTVYELNAENDGMLGLDFQSWKNNDGAKLFSTGVKYSHNYNISNMTGIVAPDGTINSHFFNFEPKWNSKFLDFLVSKSKAKVVTTGDLCVQNGSTGKILRRSGVMYAASVKIPNAPNSGNAVAVEPTNDKFKFELTITPSVTARASTLEVTVSTVSMLGYTSSGALRTDTFDSKQKVMLGTGRNQIYLGGIEKSEVVSVSNGLPFLKDLPGLGWLFSTERESTKKTRLVVVADCEVIRPEAKVNQDDLAKIEIIKGKTRNAGETNHYGYSQYLIDPATN
ncbi:MAG: type II secretion system protein GspD, partial [Victivallaceae bacterium]